ncbi:heat shock 70 kDa protein 12B-like [Ylistrum balloti]|uniref:heat shock 70 kDa protein 12B-like n=1 Tax=Ylistrum balloti TaxID=509963 RepID=UPI002905A353|nr:heat shock 70 kDa protein 12B-like [Ylistrum balloti]
MASSDEHLMVAAIDFGNRYSGYAFSFRYGYEKDPLKISTNNLTAGSRDCVDFRMPLIVRFYNPCEPGHTAIRFYLYTSTKKNLKYVTDPGCAKIGHVTITLSDSAKGLDWLVEVQISYTKTEIEITAVDRNSGREAAMSVEVSGGVELE